MSTDRKPLGLTSPASYAPELESLRGWAILLVALYHLDWIVLASDAQLTGYESLPWALVYLRAGHTGVTLFFVLSAFLLARPFLRGRLPEPGAIRRFYARRALRILPLYYTALLIAVALSAERAADWLRAVPYALFLHAWPPLVTVLYPYSGVWWSLATEIQFYLVLPLLPCLLYTRAGRVAGLVLCAGYATCYAGWVRGWIPPGSVETYLALHLSLLGRAWAFAAGIAAAALHERFGARVRRAAADNALVAGGGADLGLLALLLGLGVLLFDVATLGFFPAETTWPAWHILEGLLWAAILLAVLWLPLVLQRVFVNPLLERLGTLSYSLYLLHFPAMVGVLSWLRARGLLEPAGWSAGAGVASLIALGLCAGLSMLTYRWIERPFLERKARVA